jgi:uracil-DNA glycosylase family 4
MPNELKSDLQKAVGQARGILEDLQRLGLGEVYSQPAESVNIQSDQTTPGQSLSQGLTEIESNLIDCTRCTLAQGRNKIVFGDGDPNAKIVFIGESPGAQEDRAGEPFVDEAGKLLDRILNAMGMQRDEVYLCNVVKCFAPGDRAPSAEEIATCEPFLIQQLQSIRPEIIISLGSFVTRLLLQSDEPIEKLRGRWQQYQNIPLMPTFHPADLLLDPLLKREVWDDMKSVLKRFNDGQTGAC